MAKGLPIAGILLVFCVQFAWPQDLFASMDSIRSDLMMFSSGTTRTVTISKPKLKTVMVVPPPVKPKITHRVDSKIHKSVHKSVWGKKMGKKMSKKTKGLPVVVIAGARPHLRLIPPPRPRPETKLIFVKQRKTYRTRRTPSNKFLEAVNTIERGMAEANAAAKSGARGVSLRYSSRKLTSMKEKIKLAAAKRSYQVSRALLGKALWLIAENAKSKPRGRRAAQSESSSFMATLKSSMGPAKFDEFMAVHGDVTLMFAIDTTGSMSDEINTAKKIAVDVINYPRENPVNYMLSPFSDPTTGPVIFRDLSQGAQFVNDITKLKATGGADCPELAFKGILDALLDGPDWGSPMYVFTDAPPKDGTPENIQEVKSLAEYLGVTINFFTTGMCRTRRNAAALSTQSPDRFKEIAEATSGQMLTLSSATELKQLDALTGSVLGGSNIISVGSNTIALRRKRSASNGNYRFKVDDSIEQMSVCITTTGTNNNGIALKDPSGVIITSGKTSLSKVSIYQVSKPKAGAWTLVVPSSAGQHEYFVKSTSDTNIDFEHFFLFEMTSRRRGKTLRTDVPLSYPLKGRAVKLVITVAGANKVNKQTVALELITKHGEHLMGLQLRSVDAKGVRYITTFTPPSRPFKLKLKGSTKTGSAFERISRNIVEPKSVMLRVLESITDYTIKPGRRVSIMFQVYSAASRQQTVDIRVNDRRNFATRISRSRRTLRPGRQAFIPISFQAPLGTPVGTTDTAVVTLSVQGSNEKVSQTVQVIVM